MLETARPEDREWALTQLSRANRELDEFLRITERAEEDRLRANLDCAKAEYELARERCTQHTEIATDAGLASVDGQFALRQAVAREGDARRKFHLALKAFNDFVLDRKIPK